MMRPPFSAARGRALHTHAQCVQAQVAHPCRVHGIACYACEQGDLLDFEKQKQAELRAEIERLQEELEQNGQARDSELAGMLAAFGVRRQRTPCRGQPAHTSNSVLTTCPHAQYRAPEYL